jgi:hypothetical protein
MEAGGLDTARVIELNRNLGVPFDSRHRLDKDGSAHDPNFVPLLAGCTASQ